MSPPPRPAEAPPSSAGLLRLLDLAVLLLVGLVLGLRALSPGQDPDSPVTAFLEVLIVFAAFLWTLRLLSAREVALGGGRFLWAVGCFALAVGLAVWRAGEGGNLLQARTLAAHWAADLLLFLLLLEHLRTRERQGLVLAVLLGMVAVIAIQAVYQRAYALEYFARVMGAQPEAVASIAGPDERYQELMRGRVASSRAYGPYGYPNTLGGYLLFFLPLLWYLGLVGRPGGEGRRAAGPRWHPGLLLLAGGGMLALAFSVSRGAMLAAKAVEVLAFWGVAAWGPAAWRARRWRALEAVVVGTALAAGLHLLAARLGAPSWWLQTQVGLVWSLEILWAARRLGGGETPAPTPPHAEPPTPSGRGSRALRWLAAGILAAGVLGAAWLLAGAPGAPATLQEAVAESREATAAGRNTPGVRLNYWRAAVRMWLDHPLLGVGLDQYGVYYTHYKNIAGWAVRRAHNLYLQLLADGGILLLGSFLAVWVCFWRSPPRPEPLAAEPLGPEVADRGQLRRRLRWLAAGLTVVALLICLGPFTGLHIEFAYSELGGGPISQWPQNPWPALVHLGVHLLLMPAAAALVAWWAWTGLVVEGRDEALRRLLRLGIAGVLLHSLVDFIVYSQVIGTTLWALAALAWVRGADWRRRVLARPGAGAANLWILAAILGFGVLIWLWPLAGWQRALLQQRAQFLQRYGRDAEDLAEAARLYEEVLARTPDDPAVHRHLADLSAQLLFAEVRLRAPPASLPPAVARALLRRLREDARAWRQQARRHARRAAALEPAHAAAHAHLARTLLALSFGQEQWLREALAAAERAAGKHPYRPDYLRLQGDILARLGREAAARERWQAALALDAHPRLTDRRARLRPAERERLRAALERAPAPPSSAPGTEGGSEP